MYPLVGDRSDVPDDSVPFSQFVDRESDRSSETFRPTPKLYVVEFVKLDVGAAKVCGAGGGGCIAFFIKEGTKEKLTEELNRLGGSVLPFNFVKSYLESTCRTS